MDQSTHDVRRTNWLNIIEQCQQRPENMTVKQWLADNGIKEKSIITGSENSAKKRMSKCRCHQPLHLRKSRLLRSLFR